MADNPKIIEILLVEDNPADQELTRVSLKESRIVNNLQVAGDGKEALEFLYRKVDEDSGSLPDLIFLDLNLPGMDGREVLRIIKDDPKLKKIPVVILTSSSAEEDILKSYELHANCFVSKPLGFEQFARVVQQIEHFWFGIVRLPSES